MIICFDNDRADLAGSPAGSNPARQSVALKVGVLATASSSSFVTVTFFITDVFLWNSPKHTQRIAQHCCIDIFASSMLFAAVFNFVRAVFTSPMYLFLTSSILLFFLCFLPLFLPMVFVLLGLVALTLVKTVAEAPAASTAGITSDRPFVKTLARDVSSLLDFLFQPRHHSIFSCWYTSHQQILLSGSPYVWPCVRYCLTIVWFD